jgi:hypothetical protein
MAGGGKGRWTADDVFDSYMLIKIGSSAQREGLFLVSI